MQSHCCSCSCSYTLQSMPNRDVPKVSEPMEPVLLGNEFYDAHPCVDQVPCLYTLRNTWKALVETLTAVCRSMEETFNVNKCLDCSRTAPEYSHIHPGGCVKVRPHMIQTTRQTCSSQWTHCDKEHQTITPQFISIKNPTISPGICQNTSVNLTGSDGSDTSERVSLEKSLRRHNHQPTFDSAKSRTKPRRIRRTVDRRRLLTISTWIYMLLFQDLVLSPVVAQGNIQICNKIRGLTPPQITICQARPDAIIAVSRGIAIALAECRWQFRNQRWNCITTGRKGGIFKPELRIDSKEAAFESAIKSAGVLHAFVTACGRGEIPGCGCDERRSSFRYRRAPVRSAPTEVRKAYRVWRWGGCSADIENGLEYSTEFMEAREISKTERSFMNLHNYHVGLRVIQKKMKRKCRCHGVSGSCTMSICWDTLPTFREVGSILYNKYNNSAKRVVATKDFQRKKPNGLKLKKGKNKKPRSSDLVYFKSSPSFCQRDDRIGVFGTRGRQCDARDPGSERECGKMCCNRPHKTKHYTKQEPCDCKFFWCCRVHCAECIRPMTNYTCL